MKPGASTSSRIPALDGLRGLACLAVFGVHFHQHTGWDCRWGYVDLGRFLDNGNTGVALFFILSGFLLGLPYWKGRWSSDRRTDVASYGLRRIARIIPAYYLCLTALVVLNRHWASPQELGDTALHYLFLHNYSSRSFYSISDPFWTLAVQAQFYVLFPFMLWGLRHLNPQGWGVVGLLGLSIVAAYGAHLGLMTWGTADNGGAVSALVTETRSAVATHSVLAHLPHFLLGIVAGRFFIDASLHGGQRRRININPIWADAVCLVTAVSMVMILASPLDDRVQLPYGRYNFPVVPLFIAAIIVCAPVATTARCVLDWFPLRGLGVISYGVYVYHLPSLNVTAKLMKRSGFDVSAYWLVFATAGLALTILIATISFVAVERPALRALRKAGRC